MNFYFTLFQFVAKERLLKKDTAERYIHTHLVSVLSTGILMWGYAFLAYFTISDKTPGTVGFIVSLIHLLSPLMYRLSNNHILNSSVFIASGIIHQSCFAYYTGGFDSSILIWLGILPMLAGVISGRIGVILWSIITTLVVFVFFWLEIHGHPFPNLISPRGHIIAQSMIAFGWIFLSTIVIWVYVLLDEIHTHDLENKNQSIQNLVFILAHDISNHLNIVMGRTQLALSKIKIGTNEENIVLPLTEKSNIEKIDKAARAIHSIVDNVKDLYSTELGKKEIPLESIEVNQVFQEVKENFNEKLTYKKIELRSYTPTEEVFLNSNRGLLIHQILGNLVSNAIKFSKENDEILLRANLDEDKIQLVVEDHGVGIPESIRNKLFDVKSKTSRTGTAGESGTGFGLPIVKVYVERLGGKILVHSTTKEENENSGTKFIIEFPRELK